MHKTTEELILFEPLQCVDYSLMREVSDKRKGVGALWKQIEKDSSLNHTGVIRKEGGESYPRTWK